MPGGGRNGRYLRHLRERAAAEGRPAKVRPVPAAGGGGERRRADWRGALVRAVIYVALVAVPLTIAMRYHWLPNDDALRHAAHALQPGKPWSDIVVLREGMTENLHPGWEAILRAVHRATGGDAALLVVFGYIGLFSLFCLLPVPAMRRPEGWMAALFLVSLAIPNTFVFRLMRGRPYLFSMSVLLAVLLAGRGARGRWPAAWKTAVFFAGGALVAAVHGAALPLLALVPVAFALAGERRAAAAMAVAGALGTVAGAAAVAGTAGAWPYLREQALHILHSFGHGTAVANLVGEFQPFTSTWPVVALTGLVACGRRLATGRWPAWPGRDPLCVAVVLGGLAGLYVYRFWMDFGVPAWLLWMGFEIEASLDALDGAGRRRLAVAGVAALGFWMHATADIAGRWGGLAEPREVFPPSTAMQATPDGAETAAEAAESWEGWEPGAGGIVYADAMSVFYRWYWAEPDAPWRYMLAFESGVMPEEDLAIYRAMQRSGFAAESYRPWIRKMRPEDRFVVMRCKPESLPELEWRHMGGVEWIGRLPRE